MFVRIMFTSHSSDLNSFIYRMNESTYRIRVCLLYDFKQGKTAAETHKSIKMVFGDESISERQIRNWFERFRKGNEDLENEERGHPPKMLDQEDLRAVVEDDPSLTTRTLADMFGTSHTTIEKYLHDMGKSNRAGKWIPHSLSDVNKATRIILSGILLNKSKYSGFWDSILTSDEKWIHYDNTCRKRQWLGPGEAPKTTPKPELHGKKVMLCVWWNSKGLVHFEVLNPGDTVTGLVYAQQLERVDRVLRVKGIESSTIQYLQNNARPHKEKITQEKIEELGWESLPHPP